MSITNASVSLPAEISGEIIQNAIADSAVMQLARRIQLNGHGEAIPVITGDPTAYFVDETGVKTASDPTLTTKTMKPRTIAIIETFSNQFRDDNEALYNELVARLPKLLAQRFDQEVFTGTAVTGFDTLATAGAVSINSDPWAGLVGAKEAIESADGELTGIALSNQGETKLLATKDADGRPFFINAVADGKVGNILGVPTVKAKKAYKAKTSSTAEELGFAGDWDKAVYGIVDDVQIAIADQATVTGVGNLFEKNMFAVRCEVRMGFVCADVAQFKKLTGTPAGA